MNQTAQGVVAFDLTGNSRAVGTVMLGSGLSLLFISPFAGALADRLSKRTMLITCQALTATTFFFVGFAISAGFIIASLVVLVLLALPVLRRKREAVFAAEEA